MKKEEWNEGLNQLDPDLVEKYVKQKDKLRQKDKEQSVWLRFGAIAACFMLFLSAVIVVPMLREGQQQGDYKRISLTGETTGDKFEVLKTTLTKKTKVESIATETYSDKMPVYKITPRSITREEFQKMAEFLEIDSPIEETNDGLRTAVTVMSDKHLTLHEGNDLSYWCNSKLSSSEITLTDEELEVQAKAIFETLPLIEGEYEYLGVGSVQTAYEDEDTSYPISKRVCFRRLIDGVRVIGNDICDLYFSAEGLYDIEIKLFDYEKIDEYDMMTLDEAISKVKEPDAFVLDSDTNKNFTGAADKLTIKRTKLLFVNQYSDGCEILQPVYNLMGTVENAGGSVDFSSRIIAIPEKYTYTLD